MRLLQLLVVAAGAGVALAGSPGTIDRIAASCKPKAGYGATVGKVVEIKGDVLQGSTPVTKRTALRANAPLCATRGRRGGRIEFEVEKVKKTRCRMRPGSVLRLYPKDGQGAVIRFEAGTTSCGTGKDEKKRMVRYRVKKKGPVLVMNDPLFAVAASAKTSVVKVKVGLVKVSGRGGRTVVVGPGQQTTVPPSGAPQKPVPIQETAEDKAAFADLKSVVPKPDLGRPAVDGSPALKRIFANDAIGIGLDNLDAPSITFTDRFFAFLARSWGVDPTFDYDDNFTIRELLKQGKLEIAGTPDRMSLAAFDVMPLFADSRGATWYIAVERDKVFAEALRNFIRAAVDGGQYSAFYREAFDKEPSLDVLKPVLFG